MALDLQAFGREVPEGWGPRSVILNKNISIYKLHELFFHSMLIGLMKTPQSTIVPLNAIVKILSFIKNRQLSFLWSRQIYEKEQTVLSI